MADRHSGRGCDLHGGSRHHHRQRRVALHRRRDGRERGRGVVDRHHLSRRQRGHPHRERVSGAEVRPQGSLPGLPGIVHRKLAALRHGVEPRFPAALSHHAGARRRRHGAGLAVDPGGFLSVGKARPGICVVGDRGGRGAGRRPDVGRLDLRQLFLALELSDQCPCRTRCDGAHFRHPARAAVGNRGAPSLQRAGGQARSPRLPVDLRRFWARWRSFSTAA
jgi:hypothetical protein